jgi:hypothetical protein
LKVVGNAVADNPKSFGERKESLDMNKTETDGSHLIEFLAKSLL